MTPPATSKKRHVAQDEDFVLTLSDGDDAPIEDGNDESKSNDVAFVSNKRKRDLLFAEAPNGKTKKQKQQQQSSKGKKVKEIAGASKAESEDDEQDSTYGGEDDGALNSDFEFDVGGAAGREVTEGFDWWGIADGDENAASKKTKKKVDIDEIISRRKGRKEMEQNEKSKMGRQVSDGVDDASVDEDGNDSGMPMDFQDDELLAEDGFGMGAEREDEEVATEDGESNSSGISGKDYGSDDAHKDSDTFDDDSVATPVCHPDDEEPSDESDAESEIDAVEAEKRKAFFAPEKVDGTSAADLNKRTFQDFNLSRPILRGLASVGFTKPTPIQRRTIPVALLGKDIVGSAVTGSGKTAAFIVPILERLLFRPRKIPTSRVVILMPTRELAVQCYNVSTKLATYTDITFCQLVGGFSLREQENLLKKRPDVIIATPGRFIDHMRNSPSFTVDTLEILVLDEADRMLEDGFAAELNEILLTIPKSRQTMLFSATMTDSVDQLIRVGLNRPVRVMVDSKKHTAGTLTQEFVRLRPGREDKRLGYLLYFCKEIHTERVIIFFRQKREAHRVRIIFGLLGLKAAELHGSMSQEQRITSVESFRDGKVAFLLATDLASRGLDIKGVETVINYEAPQSHEIYLHRVGRTARAGRSGRACTLAAEPDRKVVKAAVKAGKAQGAKIISRVVDPTVVDEWAHKAEALADEVEAVLKEEREEKQMAQAEMELTKGENLLKHQAEIMSRPKRTWFEAEREKREARKVGAIALNGTDGVKPKREKQKLSNKDKKRLDDTRQRLDGKPGRKKNKAERESMMHDKKSTKGKRNCPKKNVKH